MFTDTPIETEKSWLKKGKFDASQLMYDAVEESVPKLKVRPEIEIYGKICHQNRNVGFFSDESIGYKYSNQLAESIPLTPSLKILLNLVNEITESNFNGILVNFYTSGTDSIGAHSDDESGLGRNGVVAISMGSERKFRIRDKKTKKIVKDIDLESGSIIHMGGDFQKEFTHEIPVQKRVLGVRTSFTFRHHTI
jgi:alkylated DNA repair dioxygenase AlkB